MIFGFDDFELNTDRRELTRSGQVLPTEPQVFDLLVLLVSNHHRLISKDELVEKIWRGRFISDSAISSRIKALRKILGDDGKSQSLIRTLRGSGFRFVGDVRIMPDESAPARVIDADPGSKAERSPKPRQPSIAVLPFTLIGASGDYAPIADAIPRELIASLASLRWIKVIAHGSSFRFRGSGVNVEEVGAVLGARYCLTGSVEMFDNAVSIDTELSDTRTSHVIWAMRKQARIDDIHALRAEIAANIISVAELEIPQHEAAILDFPASETLDAWTALHVGIQQVYQFSREGNERAEAMFDLAIKRDPTLARAYAGLSFVHFQNAFMRYSPDRTAEADKARGFAEQCLMLQPKDPFGNFVMGRSHWLRGDPEGSKPWFERSTRFSPNHALGHYGASWAEVFTGNYDAGMTNADRAIDLSPIDPMRPGMTGNKMWVHIARGEYGDAVHWAEIAAHCPGAHAGMACFAAMAHWLNGDDPASARWIAEARRRNPTFSYENLKLLVPDAHAEFHALVGRAAKALGLG